MGVFFLNWLSTLQGPTKNLVFRVVLFVLYLVAGAAVFQALESQYGHREKKRFDHIKDWLKSSYGMNDSALDKLVNEVNLAENEGYFDVNYDRWSFMGSLFFSATVITTIEPRTSVPRPTVTGRKTSVEPKELITPLDRLHSHLPRFSVQPEVQIGGQRFDMAPVSRYMRNKLLDGYGHLSPRTFGGRLFCIFYAFFGIPLAGLMLKSLGERMMDGIDLCIRAVDKHLLKRESRPTSVRTSMTLFIMMLAMILLLAVMAVQYEGWTYFEGVYFAFITLSTIGFGDYVPTQPTEKIGKVSGFQYHVALFILVTFVYITVGLAVVSSTLLSITRLFETKTEWEFISLTNEEEDDDDEIMLGGEGDKNANLKSQEKIYFNN